MTFTFSNVFLSPALKMAADTSRTSTLEDLPEDFGESYIPFTLPLRQRLQAQRFAREKYVAGVKLSTGLNGQDIDVKADIFKSQKKSDTPHDVSFSIVKDKKTLSSCSCSCQIG